MTTAFTRVQLSELFGQKYCIQNQLDDLHTQFEYSGIYMNKQQALDVQSRQ